MITIKNLSKQYGQQSVLNKLNYQFASKGLVCLFGPSGCGKSTLLNLLAGFDCDYEGELFVGSQNLHQLNEEDLCSYRRDHVGFIFQNYHLISGLSVLENMMLAKEDESKAYYLLEYLSIKEKAHERVECLSGGQKQRVAIARALMKDPQIILADEPTGALDRNSSKETMMLLKQLAQDHLVLVVTHDKNNCEFADEVIQFVDGRLMSNQTIHELSNEMRWSNKSKSMSLIGQAKRNFKNHLKRYLSVSIAISIGVVAFMLSLSSSNIMQQSILDFQAKNTVFNNGYIKEGLSESLFNQLNEDERIEHVYYQYVMNDIELRMDHHTEGMLEKYPMPKTTESLSYGTMPRVNQYEIALTPSLAKKFAGDIKTLIGQTLTVKYGDTSTSLTISGIYNAAYDDFFISSDLEKALMSKNDGNPYSLSYDVKSFDDIVDVSHELEVMGIISLNAAKEVASLSSTFSNLQRLFFVLSLLIFIIGYLLSVSLLWKLQSSRYAEIGLLSALGYNHKSIAQMIQFETMMLTLLGTCVSLGFMAIAFSVNEIFSLHLNLRINELIMCLMATFVLMYMTSFILNQKLIRVEPAKALKM